MVTVYDLAVNTLPGPQQAPNPAHAQIAEHGNPVQSPTWGKPTARKADGCAGAGCRKKRMLRGNSEDTGFNVTRHESEPTSDWSFIARES